MTDIQTPTDQLAKLEAENELLRKRIAQLEGHHLAAIARDIGDDRVFLENIPMGIVHVETTGAIRFANSQAQRILGLTYDELEHRYISDFNGETYYDDGMICPVEDYPATQCLITGEPQSGMMIGVRQRDDSISWAVFTASPVKPDGATAHTGALVTFVDVTEMQSGRLRQQELEEQLAQVQKLEALGLLAGGVAHDMNNILTVIGGMSFVLHRRTDDAADHTIRDALAAIDRSCRSGRDLLENLLGFARKGTHQHQPVEVNEVVHEVWSLLSRTLPESIELTHELDPSIAPVLGDSGRLANCLVNLCLNASDALIASTGERRILVTTTMVDDVTLGRRTELRVIDTGVGIPLADRSKVFEPFFTTKPFGKGTGLGLSMVFGTVMDHNGQVRIEETPGGGASIVIELPALMDVEVPISSPAIEPVRPEPNAKVRAGLHVLLIEDHLDVLDANQTALRELGCVVTGAADGMRGLELLHQDGARYDLVLLDCRLPDMDGEAIYTGIRKSNPDIPVLLTTGYAEDDMIRRMLDAGAVGMLRKPWDPSELQGFLAEIGQSGEESTAS